MTSWRTTLACLLLGTLIACSPPTDPDSHYYPERDARSSFERALAQATAESRYLMVIFGADWCPDCRKLHDNLHSSDVTAYMQEHMDFVTVDVGRKDRNLALAAELGVTVENGIPVAVFFNPDGTQLGTTNEGQLEPSRHFTSRQILKFINAVVEHHQILTPTVPPISRNLEGGG